MRARTRALLAGCVVAVTLPATAGAATIRVETDVDEFGPGGSSACTLREAVEAARTNRAFGGCRKGARKRRDTVVLPADVVLQIDGAGPPNSAGDLDVNQGGKLTIRGAPGPSPSPPAILQDGSDRHLEITRVRGVRIQGIDMNGGDNVDAGGAVRVARGAQVTLSDVQLHDNEASLRGGAVACEGCRSLRLEGAFNLDQNQVFATAGNPAEGGALWSDAPTVLDGEVGAGGLPFTNALLSGNRVLPGNGAPGSGGAIFVADDLAVTDVRIGDSDVFVGGFGGAIGMRAPFGTTQTLTLTRTTLAGNEVDGSGGAVAATADGTGTEIRFTVRRSAITGNAANGNLSGVAQGGGLYLRGARTLLADSVVASNAANGTSPDNISGGGIRASGSTDGDMPLSLIRTSVTGNDVGGATGSSGGGVYANNIQLTAVNATISGNSVDPGGGGGLVHFGAGQISHSTIAGNTVTSGTGGISHPSPEGVLRLRAAIISQAGNNCGGPAIESAGYNVEAPADPDCNLDAPTDTHSNPILQALGQNGSPAVGFGDPPPFGGQVLPLTNAFTNNSSAALDIVPPGQCRVAGERLTTDARGAPRPAEEGCDAGAIERTGCLGAFAAGPGAAIGTQGADQINSSQLSIVVAQGGADFISTYGGADRICAGAGNDEMLPGTGAGEADQISGGPGRDRLNYNNAGAGTFDLAAGTANGFPFGADTFTGIEDIQASEGSDTVLGSGGRNRLIGGGDPDTIRGRAGIDVLDARDGEADLVIDCGPGKNSRERALIDTGIDPPPTSC